MIRINDLTISFSKKIAVDHLSLEINPGDIVGLVGESGSGKSVTALSIMGLLAKEASLDSGEVYCDDQLLLKAGVKADEKMLRSYRGDKFGMVFQEPMTSLNPTMKIGYQIEEQLLLHARKEFSTKESRKEAILETLRKVGLRDTLKVYDSYPHQLSGGMRQRVMIAIAVILHPSLIIADEPTTALDVTIQNQIIKLLKDIRDAENNSMLFITHDLNLARRICTRIVVMKNGKIVEQGETESIFTAPKTEYAKKLINAIPGRSNGVLNRKAENIDRTSPILSVKDLSVFYKERGKGVFAKMEHKCVVKDAIFDIYAGETLGLVGESGCGKTSLCKAILGINNDITGKTTCSVIRPQMVFQDPYSSLNPSKTIGWLLEEPVLAADLLDKNIKTTKSERKEKAMEMLKLVGLGEEYYYRLPHQLSGGQRQRVSIAQALITRPSLVVADEPVSALDVTVQAQILELLEKLQEEFKLAYLFISHDINVIYRVCDRIMVMKKGEIVEIGSRDELFNNPQHPYTRELLAES